MNWNYQIEKKSNLRINVIWKEKSCMVIYWIECSQYKWDWNRIEIIELGVEWKQLNQKMNWNYQIEKCFHQIKDFNELVYLIGSRDIA